MILCSTLKIIEQNHPRNQDFPRRNRERYLQQHVENVSHLSTKLHLVVENIKVLATKLASMDTHNNTEAMYIIHIVRY